MYGASLTYPPCREATCQFLELGDSWVRTGDRQFLAAVALARTSALSCSPTGDINTLSSYFAGEERTLQSGNPALYNGTQLALMGQAVPTLQS